MSTDFFMKPLKETNDKALESLKRDFSRVRAGKASASLLDGLKVMAYGQSSPLNQVGSVSTPDARTIVISPWDKSILGEIEKAIIGSDIGLNPQNDGKIIRLSIPALTEDRRKELVKIVNKTGEDAKVSLRQNRKVANELVKAKEKEISEDEVKRFLELIQKSVDEATKAVDDLIAIKTKDIMTI